MRGSVVFLAAFAVSSCSVGVNGAHFIKPGIRDDEAGIGNEYIPGTGESDFVNGENDGHGIGKRSIAGLNLFTNLGHDIAKLAGFGSTAAKRQQAIDALPVLSHEPVITKPWPYPVRGRAYLKQAMPSLSGLDGEIQPRRSFKFIPLSEIKDKAIEIVSKIIPGSHALPGTLPGPSARRRYIYRSDLKNRRTRSSDTINSSSPPDYPVLPDLPGNHIALPLYEHVRDMEPAQLELNSREDPRSVLKYLVELWKKIAKWFRPGSRPGKGEGDHALEGYSPVVGDIPVEVGHHLAEGGINVGYIPSENEIGAGHHPAVEAPENVITGGDYTGGIGYPTDDGYHYQPHYYRPVHYKPIHSNWEERYPTEMRDELGIVKDDNFKPYRSARKLYKPSRYTNWEARHAPGMEDDDFEDVASVIEDASAETVRENLRDDDEGFVTNIFGRLSDD